MMKLRLSLLLLLVMPVTALGMEPGDLLGRMNAVPASAFSMTLHAHQEDVYISVWSKGALAMNGTQVDAQATVDVVYMGMKMRFKGDLRVNQDGVFVFVREMSGNYSSDFAFSSSTAYTKKWIRLADSEMLELFGVGNFLMMEEDLAMAGDMFTVQSLPGVNGTKHILQLKPDAAAEVARDILDMLGGDRPVVQDFFPWRALAESIQFEIVVQENTRSELQNRTAAVNVTGEKSYFTFQLSESFLSTLPTVVTPTNVISLEEIMAMFSGLNSDAMTEIYEEDLYEEEMDWDSFDSYDEGMLEFGEGWDESGGIEGSWSDEEYGVWSGDCWSETSAKLVAMQRAGECPVEKVSRRNLSNTR